MAYTKNQHRQIMSVLLLIASGVFIGADNDHRIVSLGFYLLFFTGFYILFSIVMAAFNFLDKKNKDLSDEQCSNCNRYLSHSALEAKLCQHCDSPQ